MTQITTTQARANFVTGCLALIGVALIFSICYLLIVINPGIESTQRKFHEGQLSGCYRSNGARIATVQNLQGDATTLKAELKLWDTVAASESAAQAAKTPPAIEMAFKGDLAALGAGISRKETAIYSLIASQRRVAIRPGSPADNCRQAFP